MSDRGRVSNRGGDRRRAARPGPTPVQAGAAHGKRTDNGNVTGPSFRFRLERVRALREHGEDLAKQDLAGAMIRRSECEERLRDADDQLDGARTAQRSVGAAPTTALDLVARQAYLERVEQARADTARDLDRHDVEVQDRRDSLAQAARAREALERLKRRSRASFDLETARAEGRDLDEIAINTFRRGAA